MHDPLHVTLTSKVPMHSTKLFSKCFNASRESISNNITLPKSHLDNAVFTGRCLQVGKIVGHIKTDLMALQHVCRNQWPMQLPPQ